MADPSAALPPSLDLPPHLSAHKYFFVCTLTVAAWDTLVLSPRSWRLLKSPGWPFLKTAYHFLRVFMPVEFTIVGVAFFDTKWSLSVSNHCCLSAIVRLWSGGICPTFVAMEESVRYMAEVSPFPIGACKNRGAHISIMIPSGDG